MAIRPESQRWIEAGKVLADDPTAKVLCPENGDGYLEVTDHVAATDPTKRERYMRCPVCGAFNILLNPRGR